MEKLISQIHFSEVISSVAIKEEEQGTADVDVRIVL